VQDSIHFANYLRGDNRIVIFADDTANRMVSSCTMTDYDTVVGGDKFGNLFALRLDAETSQEVDEDPTGNKILFEKGFLQGAAHKVRIFIFDIFFVFNFRKIATTLGSLSRW
jgi:splicing factor 3B subunit 3